MSNLYIEHKTLSGINISLNPDLKFPVRVLLTKYNEKENTGTILDFNDEKKLLKFIKMKHLIDSSIGNKVDITTRISLYN